MTLLTLLDTEIEKIGIFFLLVYKKVFRTRLIQEEILGPRVNPRAPGGICEFHSSYFKVTSLIPETSALLNPLFETSSRRVTNAMQNIVMETIEYHLDNTE